MKLNELMTTIPANRQKRLIMLKQMIDNNEVPDVLDAGGSAKQFTLADVEEIGYGRYYRTLPSRGEVDTWFTYSGPNAIRVGKKVLRKGDKTDPVFHDLT